MFFMWPRTGYKQWKLAAWAITRREDERSMEIVIYNLKVKIMKLLISTMHNWVMKQPSHEADNDAIICMYGQITIYLFHETHKTFTKNTLIA